VNIVLWRTTCAYGAQQQINTKFCYLMTRTGVPTHLAVLTTILQPTRS